VRCGIRQAEGDDLGLLACDVAGTAAATFTTNRVAAAPVRWSRQAIAGGKVRAAVVNAGNANACTGKRGLRDVEATAAKAAEVLGLAPENFLITSTGIIGHYLPVEKIIEGLPRAAQQLDASLAAGERFARAIMTTDTRLKQLALRCDLGGGAHVTLGGATKGAGMIAPGMATTLTFLTTDAVIGAPLLSKLLRRAVERTYNRISIDEHMSTNDTALCLASGLADAPPILEGTGAARRFAAALTELCRGLAIKIVADGEGATRLVRIEVLGAPSVRAAVRVGRAIADSPLCKCALHSGDPNWGRFVSAAGYACPAFEEAKAKLYIGKRLAYAAGAPSDASKADLATAMAGPEVTLRLDMGIGKAAATVWTCDLSKEYVAINADYHT
jgi:glutamate N-acetyltransferase/amino-acid N-acetyltransferase